MFTLSLTRTSEYALRAMAALAAHPPSEKVNALRLSRETSVPVPYLNKVMARLAAAGLVISAKGRGGGFRLGRPASRISFANILEETGFGVESDHCVFGWDACRSDRPCPLHMSWSLAKEDFAVWARRTTLASVVKSRP